jgi:DNA-directed RNA polymerase specialized sigma24 family protein
VPRCAAVSFAAQEFWGCPVCRQICCQILRIDDQTWGAGATSRREIPDSAPDPEVSYLQRQEARILSAATHKLKPGVRKAIELGELAELSTEETAQRMGNRLVRLKHGCSTGEGSYARY